MSQDIRFPLLTGVDGAPAETAEVLTLGTNGFITGGPGVNPAFNAETLPWKKAQQRQSPYTHIVLEFTGSADTIIGDGTPEDTIGLYGGLGAASSTTWYLLGILGYNFGNGAPQIPISGPVPLTQITLGFAQITLYPAAYDRIGVAGIFQAVTQSAVANITIKARPIHIRDYAG